ncbi:MAG: succinate dehydrogenase assembly factor 2 [Inquilinus sp.]|uniref:FAD assembly factor SdhE n=1 Tax=Inquilinus sp. TaxID=1932117 RepID=UPI003F38BFBD
MKQLISTFGDVQRDPVDLRRRRILLRCWHCGTQELDLILGSFAERALADLDTGQLAQFEALLDCSDPDLFDWILCGDTPPPEHDNDVMRRLRGFCAARGHGSRPDGPHQS